MYNEFSIDWFLKYFKNGKKIDFLKYCSDEFVGILLATISYFMNDYNYYLICRIDLNIQSNNICILIGNRIIHFLTTYIGWQYKVQTITVSYIDCISSCVWCTSERVCFIICNSFDIVLIEIYNFYTYI